jgi:long-chain acyl-CoA synthetase
MNFQVPKSIVFVDDFPRNNMGKIDKKALRD